MLIKYIWFVKHQIVFSTFSTFKHGIKNVEHATPLSNHTEYGYAKATHIVQKDKRIERDPNSYKIKWYTVPF